MTHLTLLFFVNRLIVNFISSWNGATTDQNSCGMLRTKFGTLGQNVGGNNLSTICILLPFLQHSAMI